MSKFKDKVKDTKDNLNMAWKAGEHRGQQAVVKKFDSYRAITYGILIMLIVLFMWLKNWVYVAIIMTTLHIHILMNQLYWRQASIEHYIEKGAKE